MFSGVEIGAVLSQVIDGREQPAAYGSKTLSRAETKYSVTRRELLAVVTFFFKHFRPYLSGKEFMVRTDHGSLRWLFGFKQPEGQIARWLELLASFDFDIVHRPGRKHGNADSLSWGAVGVGAGPLRHDKEVGQQYNYWSVLFTGHPRLKLGYPGAPDSR